jgi:hypothetical protein
MSLVALFYALHMHASAHIRVYFNIKNVSIMFYVYFSMGNFFNVPRKESGELVKKFGTKLILKCSIPNEHAKKPKM